MTVLTEGLKTCDRDTGLLRRDCDCSDCTELKSEFYGLFFDLASNYLNNRSPEEKELREKAVWRSIDRYKAWL